ncbi:hypothetical protein M413DRAFT_439044 [Hebeloma cylindrosporum]|uniref:Uncharacterized protein n=1 Tax=Hebeloma cylindrosporum TaxID=76867 RepID=A0A0C3D0H0_HEBCY|nr:hypothetical protein M413DRAFT_439044 [Hebeloma cylindrosporum h7]
MHWMEGPGRRTCGMEWNGIPKFKNCIQSQQIGCHSQVQTPWKLNDKSFWQANPETS